MRVDSVLNFTGANTPPIFCQVGGGFQLTVSGMSGTDSLIIQKSSDNGVTWLTHTTVSADGTATAVADASTAMGIRAIADILNAGHSWTISLKNVMDASGVPSMAPFQADYIYDFALHGGADPTNVLLVPSVEVPDGTIFTDFVRETLTPFVCPGANPGMAFTGGTYDIEAGSETGTLVKDALAGGLKKMNSGIGVYFHNQGAVITAGKARWTLIGVAPQV